MKKHKTTIINLIGSSGVGKSTLASELFAKMKWMGYSVELVGEFAKDLVWEDRKETIKNEVYIFAKQHHRVFRLIGKVDYIVTDRPLILSCHYNKEYGDASDEYEKFVMHEVNKMKSINIFLHRTKKYIESGRNQTERESDNFSDKIELMLQRLSVPYYCLNCVETDTSDDILAILSDDVCALKTIKKKKICSY